MGNLDKKIWWVYGVMFIFALHLGLTSYVNSTLLTDIFGVSESKVGLVFTIASIVSFTLLLGIARQLHRIPLKYTMIAALLLHLAASLALYLFDKPLLGIIVYVFYYAAGVKILLFGDIFVEHYSHDNQTGRIRGWFLTIVNSGWVIAPIIAGWLINNINIQFIYVVGFFLSALALALVWTTFDTFNEKTSRESSFFHELWSFFKRRELRQVFTTNMMLNFFYASMIIYSPLYLHTHIGLSWERIGLIFSIMLVAFPMTQWLFGKWADTRWGEKEIMTFGFLLAGITSTVIAFLQSDIWWVWAIVFFLSRLGTAAIEAMNETYFYKHINESQIEKISLYRVAFPLAYILAPLFASFVLFLISPNLAIIFVSLGAFMIMTTAITTQLRDTK